MALFQNLTVDYKNLLGKLSVTDRIRLLYTDSGQNMLASLTAEQYARLFPTYYREKMPEISGFMKALTSEGRKALINAQQIREGTYSSPDGQAPPRTELAIPAGRAKPSVLQRLEKILDAQGISNASAMPELSTQQKELIKKMREGQVVSADNETAAFISKLPPDVRQQVGIMEAVDEAGKPAFKMAPTQVTKQEVEAARKSTVSGGSNKEIIMKSFADELRKQGVPEANIPYAVAAMAGQVQAESGFNPKAVHDKGTGYGIYGARDPSPGRGRRTDMFKWLEANGYDKDSPEGQARYMVHEAFTRYPKTRDALVGANKDNIGEVTGVLVNDFERPKERPNNIRIRTQHSVGFFESATRIAENRDLAGNMTDEQIEQIIKERKERAQENTIASRLERPKLPDGVDPKFVEEYNRLPLGQAQRIAKAIEARGVEQFNNDLNLARDQDKNNQGAESRVSSTTSAGGPRVGTVIAPGAPGASNVVQSQQTAASIRTLPIKAELENYLDFAAKESGVKFVVTSGGQTRRGRNTGSFRHDVDNPNTIGAADGYLQYTDPATGKTRRLSIEREEDKPLIAAFTRSFAKVAPDAGVGTGYMPGPRRNELFHFGGPNRPGDPAVAYAGPSWFRQSFYEGRNSFGSDESKQAFETHLAARTGQNVPGNDRSSASSVVQDQSVQREIYEEAVRSVFGDPTKAARNQQLSRGGTVQAPGAPGTLMSPPGAAPPAQAPAQTTTAPAQAPASSQQSTATATTQAPAQAPAQGEQAQAPAQQVETQVVQETQTIVQSPEEQPQPTVVAKAQIPSGKTPKIPQFYAGGEKTVDGDSITAFPITGLNGDNAIVADSNKDPLFTMNTNKESASYDPKSGKVEVQPVKKNEPETLKSSESAINQTPAQTQNEFPTPQENTNSSEMRPAPAIDPNYSLQAAIMSSANPFTTPSFERAVNAANFKRTGYHFDHGAANLR